MLTIRVPTARIEEKATIMTEVRTNKDSREGGVHQGENGGSCCKTELVFILTLRRQGGQDRERSNVRKLQGMCTIHTICNYQEVSEMVGGSCHNPVRDVSKRERR